MVKKETCPVCKGNKVVQVTVTAGDAKHRTCPGCNGVGYQVKMSSY
jgi:DnaJ-class molecular chaperone